MKWNKTKFANAAISLLFLTAIFLPVLDGGIFHFSSRFTSTEKRKMAPNPSFAWDDLQALKDFPKKYEAYFNDNFGFRNLLVRWASLVRLKYLGISPSPLIIAGKEGWLYYHGDQGRDGAPIANYRGLRRYSEQDLAAIRQNL